jgi:hypothetical protein
MRARCVATKELRANDLKYVIVKDDARQYPNAVVPWERGGELRRFVSVSCGAGREIGEDHWQELFALDGTITSL